VKYFEKISNFSKDPSDLLNTKFINELTYFFSNNDIQNIWSNKKLLKELGIFIILISNKKV
jgi:hypothetical protein